MLAIRPGVDPAQTSFFLFHSAPLKSRAVSSAEQLLHASIPQTEELFKPVGHKRRQRSVGQLRGSYEMNWVLATHLVE